MMRFRRDTVRFRLALTVGVLWFVFVAAFAAYHYRSLNASMFTDSAGCGGTSKWDVDYDCVVQAMSAGDRELADAKRQVVIDGALYGIIPAILLVVLAGFSQALGRLFANAGGSYWRWLRTGKRQKDASDY